MAVGPCRFLQRPGRPDGAWADRSYPGDRQGRSDRCGNRHAQRHEWCPRPVERDPCFSCWSASRMSDPLGEAGGIGGIFAGTVAVLGLLGGGIRWMLNWKERREESRSAKLQAWHDELAAREKRLDAERERDIASLRE